MELGDGYGNNLAKRIERPLRVNMTAFSIANRKNMIARCGFSSRHKSAQSHLLSFMPSF
jgi:hypothetical protein